MPYARTGGRAVARMSLTGGQKGEEEEDEEEEEEEEEEVKD